MNPHLISVRINERFRNLGENIKRLSYLLDLKTIGVCEFHSGLIKIPNILFKKTMQDPQV